jgi:hypothetical protein
MPYLKKHRRTTYETLIGPHPDGESAAAAEESQVVEESGSLSDLSGAAATA